MDVLTTNQYTTLFHPKSVTHTYTQTHLQTSREFCDPATTRKSYGKQGPVTPRNLHVYCRINNSCCCAIFNQLPSAIDWCCPRAPTGLGFTYRTKGKSIDIRYTSWLANERLTRANLTLWWHTLGALHSLLTLYHLTLTHKLSASRSLALSFSQDQKIPTGNRLSSWPFFFIPHRYCYKWPRLLFERLSYNAKYAPRVRTTSWFANLFQHKTIWKKKNNKKRKKLSKFNSHRRYSKLDCKVDKKERIK